MMNKKLISFIAALTLISVGWLIWNRPQTKPTNNDNQLKAVNAIEFAKLADQQETFVLDVHIPEQNHIAGTDAFIPYSELESNLDQLPTDKNTPIAVYCRSGSMSREASQKLIDLGYTQVYDLVGGINAYKEANVAVKISPAVQDLGTVIYGEVAETEFELTNFTPNAIRITRVATSCGCTKAEIIKDELKPYESTTVKVTFDPAVHQDDTDLGDITRTIYLDTDHPNFKQVTAQIEAVVVEK
jgi:rhodanese-related sulfurtransferase